MITYKGSNLLRGRSFLLEMDGKLNKVKYKGKVYGNQHAFDLPDGVELILTEQEVSKLEPYNILKEHSLLEEQDNKDDLYQIVTSYTDKQLKMIEDLPSNKLWTELKNSFQEELNKLADAGLAYQISFKEFGDGNEQYLLEIIMDYLQEINHNISGTSMPNHYTQLSNFIYSIDQLGSDK